MDNDFTTYSKRLEIIEHYHKDKSLSYNEIASRTGSTRAIVFHTLSPLIQLGILDKNPRGANLHQFDDYDADSVDKGNGKWWGKDYPLGSEAKTT